MNIKSKKTKAFNIVLGFFMVVITLITLYPVWFSVINSLNSASGGCGRFLGPELSNSKTASILHRTQTP